MGLDNGKQKLQSLMDKYQDYKRRFAKDIRFDFTRLSATIVDSKLKVVQIYFDTATYDVVEKDQKVINIG